MRNLLDVRGPRKDMADPRTLHDTGTAGPCIHCGHYRSEVDGKNQCLVCVIYIWLKENDEVGESINIKPH